MSRQGDRRGHEPEVRIAWLEDDMDRVDREFDETVGKIEHAKGNWRVVADDLGRKVDKLDAKIDHVGEKAAEEIAGNRKVMVGVLISTLSVAIAIVAQVLIMRGGS